MNCRQILLMTSLLVTTGTAQADVGFVHALPQVMLAQPCGAADSCSYTWTLATRLGDVLRYTEELYGERDKSWTLLGVEFAATEAPQVWYPGYSDGRKHILIQLTESTARNEKQALYQLAHEVVHTLSPNGPELHATVLEEGIATYNSIEYPRYLGFDISAGYVSSAPYEAAYALIVELASVQPDFADGVKQLRQRHGSLSAITARDLMRVFPAISPALAERLAETF